MKRSFSLIEVLVAVMIMMLTLTALLRLQKNSIDYVEYIQSQNEDYRAATAVMTLLSPKYNKLERSVYDIVKDRYTIENEEIKKVLQEKKMAIEYLKKEINDPVYVKIESYKIGNIWVDTYSQ